MDDDAAAVERLAGFLAAYEPAIEQLVHHGLDQLDQVLPGAVRLVYDNWNATVVGYTPDGRASRAVCSLAAYPRWANLFFFAGEALADPRLEGDGSTVRRIRVTEPSDLDDHALGLVRRAAEIGGWSPVSGAEVTTRIVVVSERRKPRRPRRT